MIVLGIDVGGTGIKGAPVDLETGHLVAERHRVLTPRSGTPEDVAAAIGQIARHFEWSGPFGCTLPMVVKKGIVTSRGNMAREWIGLDAPRLLHRVTGLQAAVLNDADAAALAEMRFGAGRDERGVVMVLTFGTGIGSSLFVDGELVPNTAFGDLTMRGRKASLLASDKVRKARRLTWKHWAKRVNEFLVRVETVLPPDLILLGGGASEAAHAFLGYLHADARIL